MLQPAPHAHACLSALHSHAAIAKSSDVIAADAVVFGYRTSCLLCMQKSNDGSHVHTPPRDRRSRTYKACPGTSYRGDEAELRSGAFTNEALRCVSDEDACACPHRRGPPHGCLQSQHSRPPHAAAYSDQFRALQKLIYVSDLVFGVQKACAFSRPYMRLHVCRIWHCLPTSLRPSGCQWHAPSPWCADLRLVRPDSLICQDKLPLQE